MDVLSINHHTTILRGGVVWRDDWSMVYVHICPSPSFLLILIYVCALPSRLIRQGSEYERGEGEVRQGILHSWR